MWFLGYLLVYLYGTFHMNGLHADSSMNSNVVSILFYWIHFNGTGKTIQCITIK